MLHVFTIKLTSVYHFPIYIKPLKPVFMNDDVITTITDKRHLKCGTHKHTHILKDKSNASCTLFLIPGGSNIGNCEISRLDTQSTLYSYQI